LWLIDTYRRGCLDDVMLILGHPFVGGIFALRYRRLGMLNIISLNKQIQREIQNLLGRL
jgi:hypothetical protein